jgi:RND superfamily putative drug exporter
VILGLTGMLAIDVEIFKTVAVSGAVIVIFSLFIALTFLPALLSIIGRNINRLQVIKIKENDESIWYRFSKFVMNRAGVMALISFGILLSCSVPIFKMKLSIPDATALPKEYDTRIAYEMYEKEFLGENHSEVLMVVRAKENDVLAKESLKQLENLLQALKKEEIVASVDSIFSIMGDLDYQQLYMLLQNGETRKRIAPFINKLVKGNQTIFTVHLNVEFDSEEAKEFAKRWEKNDDQIEVLLGGLPKFNQEIYDEISENFKYSLLIVFVSI